eukprot:1160954-Pelagomonas_calceolata.AAC.7
MTGVGVDWRCGMDPVNALWCSCHDGCGCGLEVWDGSCVGMDRLKTELLRLRNELEIAHKKVGAGVGLF